MHTLQRPTFSEQQQAAIAPQFSATGLQIRVGFEMVYECPAPTPMILSLHIHHSRAPDLIRPDILVTHPAVPVTAYRDMFGNWCSRIVAPAGRLVLSADALVHDSGETDPIALGAPQVPVEQLPESTLVFLLGSRYCETDQLSNVAWQLFGNAPTGWHLKHRLCDGTPSKWNARDRHRSCLLKYI